MIEIGRVVAIHPEDHSLDVLLLRNGHRATGVPLVAPGAGTRTGLSDLPPVVAPPGDERWNVAGRTPQDALAVLAPTAGGNWVALGLIFPQQNAVLSAEAGRAVYRHSSGAWHMIAPDGTMTIGHPSGATITMGPNLSPVNPVGGDVDGQWSHAGPNAGAAVGLHLAMPSGATLTIATNGKVTVTAIGEMAVVAPLASFTGNVTVAGNVTSAGNVTAAGDMTAGTISLRNHIHTGVQSGSGSTAPATA